MKARRKKQPDNLAVLDAVLEVLEADLQDDDESDLSAVIRSIEAPPAPPEVLSYKPPRRGGKLTGSLAWKIRWQWRVGIATMAELARAYGFAPHVVRDLVHGRRYADLPHPDVPITPTLERCNAIIWKWAHKPEPPPGTAVPLTATISPLAAGGPLDDEEGLTERDRRRIEAEQSRTRSWSRRPWHPKRWGFMPSGG